MTAIYRRLMITNTSISSIFDIVNAPISDLDTLLTLGKRGGVDHLAELL